MRHKENIIDNFHNYLYKYVSIVVHFNVFCYKNMKSCTTAVHQNLA